MNTISNFRLFFLILIILGLTACGSTSLPFKYNKETFVSSNKGVAIIRVSQATNFSNKADLNLSYELKKCEQNGTYIVPANNSFFVELTGGITRNKYDYSQSILMLDPGIYYFDHISLLGDGSNIYWYPSPGIKVISKNNAEARFIIKYGAFKINSGEVTYIGHLNLNRSGNLPFEVINEIEKAKKDLIKQGHTDLSQRLKPTEFYGSGSIYINHSNNKDGLIISKQKIDQISSRLFNKVADEVLKTHKK